MIGTLLTSGQRVRSTRICGPVLLSILLASVNGCIDPGDPGTLVPPTVDEDLDLPGMVSHVVSISGSLGIRAARCCSSCPGKPNPEWPVWRPGALALIVWERSVLSGTSFSYHFTPGLDRFTGEVLIVGTECSPLGTEFQEKTNLTVFQNATRLHIPDSNHRILTEQFDALVTGLRDFLDPVGAATAGGGS